VMAKAKALNLIATSESVAGVVTKEEMIRVYDQRMAGKGGPGRAIYDKIKLLPHGDRCPFCDQRNVSTLDHILPKTSYPSLAVAPLNLVGACMECNKAKSSLAPKNPEQVVFHPYFDDITASQWLIAEVVQQTPCAIVFDIAPPAGWDNVTEARAKAQFECWGCRICIQVRRGESWRISGIILEPTSMLEEPPPSSMSLRASGDHAGPIA
jgi:hypothetical protein